MEHHTCWRLTKTRSTQHAAIGAAGDIGLSSLSHKYMKETETDSRCSIVVSIPACHAGDPGSIPGNGVLFIFWSSINSQVYGPTWSTVTH